MRSFQDAGLGSERESQNRAPTEQAERSQAGVSGSVGRYKRFAE
jgi:hypothetical protein